MSEKTDKGDKVYIQDKSQKIRGNLDISGNWDEYYDASQMWTLVAIIPEIGALVEYQGKSYEIVSTRTFQEKVDKVVITTFCRILPISDEGDDISGPDNPVIEVQADELTLI